MKYKRSGAGYKPAPATRNDEESILNFLFSIIYQRVMHTTLQSPKKKRAQKKRTKFVAAAVFAVVACLAWGIVKFFTFPTFQITGVTVRGAKILSEEDIKKKAEKYLSGNYYLFFPKRNVLLYPKAQMKADLFESFPAMAAVMISVGDSKRLAIDLSEREPIAIWCGASKPDITAVSIQKCYYVDKTGYIFFESPRFSGDAYFTLYGTGSKKAGDPLGQYLVAPEVFVKVLKLQKFLSEDRISADNLYFGSEGYAEFFDPKGFAIKWNTDQNVDAIISNMAALFRSPSWKDGSFVSGDENPEPLEYLDFRFGNKLFYKQKGQEPETPMTPTEESSTTTPIAVPLESMPTT
ncbi:MAG: hypothetical protein WCT49_02500 [Candidatus Paceibacterota bacterium]|jgi:hypothetical protein|nr:hypothetical protein [Candidatus Paceibacterota bacterium]